MHPEIHLVLHEQRSQALQSEAGKFARRARTRRSATPQRAVTWRETARLGVPFFIVTQRPQEQPSGGHFIFVGGVEEAVAQAKAAAGDKNVNVMGGADIIRQALGAGLVDDLTIIVAPILLGGGKRLFEGFSQSLDLEQTSVQQSAYATFLNYRITRG